MNKEQRKVLKEHEEAFDRVLDVLASKMHELSLDKKLKDRDEKKILKRLRK